MMPRNRIQLDTGWKFKMADAELLKPYERWLNAGGALVGPPSLSYDDSTWRDVNLPHDFVIEGGFEQGEPVIYNSGDLSPLRGSRPVGIGWYRKHFNIPESYQGCRIYIYFDGVYRDSRIYLNQYWVGGCASGYSSFFFDITDMIKYGGNNLLAVRVDASQPEGWFYEGGGIYRHVWLITTAPMHILPDGTFINSQINFNGSSPTAVLNIETELLNKFNQAVTARLVSTIIDPLGNEISEVKSEIDMLAGVKTCIQQHVKLPQVHLWSLEDPALYRVVSTILQGNSVIDRYETRTGIRSIRFDPDTGFYLNEKPTKIQGVCCHQDHAGVGSAFPDRLHEYRLSKLKKMGCNAYRCAHHPPAPELLDAADRLGMLVMDEKRRMSSSPPEITELENIIRRDRNHPSIILWSIGNEEVFVQWTPQAELIAHTLQDCIHRMDPTRPVTLAICFWNPAIGGEEDLSHIPYPARVLDVMGINYAVNNWEGYHRINPNQPIVISEASTNFRTRGCYVTRDETCQLAWDDPRSEHLAEEQWAKVAASPYLSGIFLWTGFDYHGEPAPYSWPAISSQFGIMDLCGFPKDNYYYYKAAWKPEPLVHIFPHWNWLDRLGETVKVGCYTNCEEVELFLNDQSLGRKTVRPNYHLEWPDVTYQAGKLEAIGYRNGQSVASTRVETTGPATTIHLLPDRTKIHSNRDDVCIIDVEITDDEGRIVPNADHQIYFEVNGPGRIIGVGNGDPASHEPEQANHRRAFNGLCQVILQPSLQQGMILFSAHAAGLKTAVVQISIS